MPSQVSKIYGNETKDLGHRNAHPRLDWPIFLIPIVDSLWSKPAANPENDHRNSWLERFGVWENGIWNNGYRSNNLLGEKDYYLFSNIVGLNGVTPFAGKGTYQIDSVTWLVTLQSIETLEGLVVGDKVSIGNLIAIDINESRRLIKDYFTINYS